MSKVLDLRKKVVKAPQPRTFRAEGFSQSLPEATAQKVRGQALQKPREEIKIEKKIVKTPIRPKLVAHQARQSFAEQNFDEQEEIVSTQKPHISWEAPSFYYNPQKRYLSMLIVALLLGAAALLMFKQDTLTSIFLILSSLVLIIYGSQKPTISKIIINQSGVLVDDRMHDYKELKSFWIEYNPGGPKELSLESAKWYFPYIKILLNSQNPIELRSLLVNFLPEKEHESSLVDHVGKKLGL